MIVVQQFWCIDEIGREMNMADYNLEEPKHIAIEYYDYETEDDCEVVKQPINNFISWLNQTDTGYIHRATDRIKDVNDNGEYVEDIVTKKINFSSLYDDLDLGIVKQFLNDII